MKTATTDPQQARDYFRAKLEFTTGPVELDRILQSHNPNVVVVDVRDQADYRKGHIPGAINLPRGNWVAFTGLRKDKLNIVYCYNQNCHLAAAAAVDFAAHGYPVMEMDGGFAAWRQCKLAIRKGEGREALPKAA